MLLNSARLVHVMDTSVKDIASVLKKFVDQADGRDKALALVQYMSMFMAGDSPGRSANILASVGKARKVFRLGRPLDTLTPLALAPSSPRASGLQNVLSKSKVLLLALYFGGDNVVWACQTGLIKDADLARKSGEFSMWCWFFSQLCILIDEGVEIVKAGDASKAGEELKAMTQQFQKRRFVIVQASTTATLALALLGKGGLSKKSIGLIGCFSAGLNLWTMLPPFPHRPTNGRSA